MRLGVMMMMSNINMFWPSTADLYYYKREQFDFQLSKSFSCWVLSEMKQAKNKLNFKFSNPLYPYSLFDFLKYIGGRSLNCYKLLWKQIWTKIMWKEEGKNSRLWDTRPFCRESDIGSGIFADFICSSANSDDDVLHRAWDMFCYDISQHGWGLICFF